MLSAEQGDIKYHFCDFGMTTWNGISVSQTIGEHSNHYDR